MKVMIFDYGAGNIHSLAKALASPTARIVTETDPLRAIETDVLVLPGVGNFGAVTASDEPSHGQPASALLRVPPLGTLWLRWAG